MHCFQNILLILVISAPLIMAIGCTTQARQGAAQGGAMGLVGGMAAGAVNSLLFGGNIVEGAVQGGLTGAAGGAAAGAMTGGMSARQADTQKQAAAKSDKDIEALRLKLGDLNFQAAVLLVQGQRNDAVTMANRAIAETAQSDRKVFGLTVRAVAENESGNTAAAEKTYAEIAKVDPKRSIDKARGDTLQALLKVQGLRKENGIKAGASL